MLPLPRPTPVLRRLLVNLLLVCPAFAHDQDGNEKHEPKHADLRIDDFFGEITFQVGDDNAAPKQVIKVRYERLAAVIQKGTKPKDNVIIGWDYHVTITQPAELSETDRVLSLYTLGLQGYRDPVEVIGASADTEYFLPDDSGNATWSGLSRASRGNAEKVPGLKKGPHQPLDENIGFIRHLTASEYWVDLRVVGIAGHHYGHIKVSTDTKIILDPAEGIRSSHDNVPPRIPPGSSETDLP